MKKGKRYVEAAKLIEKTRKPILGCEQPYIIIMRLWGIEQIQTRDCGQLGITTTQHHSILLNKKSCDNPTHKWI